MSTTALSEWQSFHLYYHGSRDRLLIELVRPLVQTFLAAGQIDSFFFVRFALGGPHIRLRLRTIPGHEAAVQREVEHAAESFFARAPSTESLTADTIRQGNGPILASDPNEEDDGVYPDNSVRLTPFRPETKRYGGPLLLPRSLDVFAVSSAEVFRFLAVHRDTPAARRLADISRLLVRQAFYLADGSAELTDLLGYGVDGWGTPLQAIVQHADEVFARQSEPLCRLLRSEIDALLREDAGEAPEGEFAGTVRHLRWQIAAANATERRRIGCSQLHMTANRLGLTNPDEVYLGRLLGRALRQLEGEHAVRWERFRKALARCAAQPLGAEKHVRDLITGMLDYPAAFPDLSPPLQPNMEDGP